MSRACRTIVMAMMALILAGCSKTEHVKSVTLYDYKGMSNTVFKNVSIYEKRSNYISFVSGDIALEHNGRYVIER